MKTMFAIAFLLPLSAAAQTYVCGARSGGATQALTAATVYSNAAAGFDRDTAPERVDKTGCSSTKTFFFSMPAKEGNYLVTVELGGPADAMTTVRAESRRVMLARIATRAGKYRTESFTVNVRVPEIPGDGVVKRKPREMGALNWDDKLTLEFSGDHPSVRNIRVEPAKAGTPTVYLAGDSTVVDQDNEPWAAWGQMLPAFFGPGVAIANHAESGETIRSFEGEKRFAKIFSQLKSGDYLFFQFAHNDQKPGSGFVSPEMYTGLLRKYVGMARERGATPVLVTSMNRRTFDATGHITDSLAPYPQTMRDFAQAEHVALIDLNAMSKTLYEAVGEPASRSLFVYAPANTYPGQPQALHDDTHFNAYGAWELARCMVLGLQESGSPLVRYLREPQKRFQPQHPDPASSVFLPPAPFVDVEKPYER
ncbi:MAG TPA: rhamnogalacturonan acetylesterase [Acidobacteriaceae bacterium]|jgi:lysophospholipase L1-like esterase